MIDISVIMPIFTRPDYLKETLNSLSRQTFKNYELILIDDCVEDNDVLAMLDNYRKQENIKIIKNDINRGAAYSRNAGLKYATGKYVIFLDSDDIFNDLLLEKMYKTIIENKSDICISGYSEFIANDDEKIQVNLCLHDFKDINDIKKMDDLLINAMPYMWNKLVKKDLLIKNDIHFQEISSCNDLYCSYMCIACADSISFVNEPLIEYRISSKMSISNKRNSNNLSIAYKYFFNELEKRNLNDDTILRQSILALMNSMDCEIMHSKNADNNKKLYNYVQFYLKNNNLMFKDKKNNLKSRIIIAFNYKIYINLLKLKQIIKKLV